MVFSLKNEAQIASSISITFFAISFDTDTYDMNGSVQFDMTRGILQHNTLYIFTLKYVEVTHELFSFINKYQVDTLSNRQVVLIILENCQYIDIYNVTS